MHKRTIPVILAGLVLAGCGSSATTNAGELPGEAQVSPAPMPEPVAVRSTQPAPRQRSAPIASTQKGVVGAQAILATWAQALETHDFGRAWVQFSHPPAARDAFARWWRRYRTIRVTTGPGEMEGAAGSSYYTAPATISGVDLRGRAYLLQGDVVLRRVNDVDGATPAELRWHIESADLKNVLP
ncbi:hypothetical protein HNO88_003751 [Novosphingobium chloroacetimidivorans]|uniref:Lipoprotein n=1 Tax=Novosphingobium chloroacetimidivorans TaxID=1428314 RepID=A0A7W7NX86_9SPHN|nr:hypothetical protein [Novosphingobium chloroacetimidivorans]MBB4860408.1 hypothetical protein [Novosphingobium chloroacetimidivorans]